MYQPEDKYEERLHNPKYSKFQHYDTYNPRKAHINIPDTSHINQSCKRLGKKKRKQASYRWQVKDTEAAQFDLQQMLYLVNYERAQAKPVRAGPLRINSEHIQASQIQSDYQAQINRLQYEGPPGNRKLRDRINTVNYMGGAFAENVGRGYRSVEVSMMCWMRSPCHRASLLNPAYTEFGAAVNGTFWTQVFGLDGYLTEDQKDNPNLGECDPINHKPTRCVL